MNKILLTAIFVLSIISSCFSQITWTWTGANSDLWSDEFNWDDGFGLTGVPTAGDVVIFDVNGGNSNCTIDINTASLSNFSMDGGYTGTITQSPGVSVNTIDLTINSGAFIASNGAITVTGDFAINSGSFIGGTGTIRITGSFFQTGGVFTASSNQTRISNNFTSSSGDFNHNNGTVFFNDNSFVVNSSRTFYNLTFGNSNNLAGVTFTLANTLTVLNTFSINTGNLSGARPITLNNGIINVFGNLSLIGPNNGVAPTSGGGTTRIILNGVGNQTISNSNLSGTVVMPQNTIPLPNLEISTASDRVITFPNAQHGITINGELTLSGIASTTINIGTINVKGNLNLLNSGPNGGGSGTIVLNNSNTTQTINGNSSIGNSTLPNLTIDKGTAGLTFLSTISIAGSLTYTNSGAITNTGSTIAYVGGAQQILAPTGTFPKYNILAIGGTATKTVSNNVVTGFLVMNSADLDLGTSYLQVDNTASNAVSFNGVGKVIGDLRRAVTTGVNYSFPVGSTTQYKLATINLSSITGFSILSIQYNTSTPYSSGAAPYGSPINFSESGGTFTNTKTDGFWQIAPIGGGTGVYSLRLYSPTFTEGMSYVIAKRVAPYDATTPWTANGVISNGNGSGDGIQTDAQGSYVMRTGMSGFSNFVVAVSNDPLPVDLKSFHAKLVQDYVQLDWVTLTETKSSHFVIERSRDSHSFDSIGTVLSAGNSSERLEYDFADLTATDILAKVLYYRLKQVDVDGQSKTYPMVGVDVENIIRNSKIKIFPNPATVDVTVASYLKEDVQLDIYNPLGKIVDKKKISSGKTTVDTSNLEQGVYVFKFINGSTVINKKVIIK